ncbi:MAG: hypothetical protein ACTSQ8_22675 [Candidatus Helarchaeota archaeon]
MLLRIIKRCRIWLLILVLCFIIPGDLKAQNMFFVYNGPSLQTGTAYIPFETRIYSFDEVSGSLEKIWTLGLNKEAMKLGIYQSANKMIVIGDRDLPNIAYVFSLDNPDNISSFSIDSGDLITDYHYYQALDKEDVLHIKKGLRRSEKSTEFEWRYYSTSGQSMDDPGKIAGLSYELRLSGPRPIGGNEDDIITILNPPKDSNQLKFEAVGIDLETISDSAIQMESERGWVIIANEPQYTALLSLPDRNGLTKTNLLIYNRFEHTWCSVLVKGGVSAPRPINNWLIGPVKEMNPESDYKNRKTFPPILTGEWALIDPLNGGVFYLDLGLDGEILWIDKNILYYKRGNNLCKANFEQRQLTNEIILVTDPAVNHFHWAFGEDNKIYEKK